VAQTLLPRLFFAPFEVNFCLQQSGKALYCTVLSEKECENSPESATSPAALLIFGCSLPNSILLNSGLVRNKAQDCAVQKANNYPKHNI
jgi:hypothetical protein